MHNFVVGLDLGQAADYTALAVLELVPQFAVEDVVHRTHGLPVPLVARARVEKPSRFDCRHLHRYALGTRYPEIVESVASMLSTPQLRGAALVVDGTGVGRPVVDMFREAGLKPVPVTITGGIAESHSDGYWHVPKRNLVGAVQAPLQDGRLKFAEGMPLVDTLVQEMLNFQVKITTSANDTYGAWREGTHDDLILAVMLAAWWGTRMSKPKRVARSYQG